MTDYTAPLDDIRFALTELAGLDRVAALPGYQEATPDLVDAVLEEAGKLAGNVLGPLNRSGDVQSSRLIDGAVRTPDGFPEAFKAFADGGWIGLAAPQHMGGQGLPKLIAVAVEEMWQAANMGFAVGPLLTQAAIDLLVTHGTEDQRETYLAKLISGQWTGTMNLTESLAGSDLGEIRTRAERHGDHYRIKGQKIFITYGDHDLAENIIHMVLARSPDGIPGIKGISLYIVPKMLDNDDGSLGAPNDVRAASLEHKLGINASPTAVMLYGENDGATAYLVGEENRGIEYMFLMMNQARVGVGVQGLAIAERAYQGARAYARERVQGTAMSDPRGERKAIIDHPDVRRMLLGMKARIEAARGLIYYTAAALDRASHHQDEATRTRAGLIADLLVPVAKAWSTDLGVEVASDAIQVHGGMGFIEETGAAQHYRDARIAPIYEGTNGIQALDLIGRKLPLQGGGVVRDFLGQVRDLDGELAGAGDEFRALRQGLAEAVEALGKATEWMLTAGDDARDTAAGATPYLRLFGIAAGGYMMALAALAAQKRLAAFEDETFHRAKIATARFYAEQILPQAPGLLGPATRGAGTLFEIDTETLNS